MRNETFIEKANSVHLNQYDYSLVEYINSYTKIKIICPKHGEFEQTPNNHLKKQGCSICGLISRKKTRSKPKDKFTNEANLIHNNKYDYSLMNYINSKTNIKIICPEHGLFEQTPSVHLKGFGCIKCSNKVKSDTNISTKETFINKANTVHLNQYDYSLVEYNGSQNKVNILCPEHGLFEQTPNSHLKGRGCPICGLKIKGGWTTTKWLEKANNSTQFDSFKFYLIECWNDTEQFIKYGRTFKTIKKRFEGKIPYQYKTLKEIKFDNHLDAFDYENNIKSLFKDIKYTPLSKFCGMYECLNINQKDFILSNISFCGYFLLITLKPCNP